MSLYSPACACCHAPESHGCLVGQFACRCQHYSREYLEQQHPPESTARLFAGATVDTCVTCNKCPGHCACPEGYRDSYLTLEAAAAGKPYPVRVPHDALPRDPWVRLQGIR